ncbi:MAG: coenzyme F420-0:L-glutamate ligase [Methermicoccaceae archaeon]
MRVEIIAVRTRVIEPHDDVLDVLDEALEREGIELEDGDVLVVSESALSTALGGVVRLSDVKAGHEACELGRTYSVRPEVMQLIIEHSESIIGGIEGYVLALRDGFLCPNAGIDTSNAPEGCVVLPLSEPNVQAGEIRLGIRAGYGVDVGVVVSDSRTHPLRLGCVGIAVGVSGMRGITDARGQRDLFGKPLAITRRAMADDIASAAQLLMGEGDECVPFAIVRGLEIEVGDIDEPMPTLKPQECLYFGSLINGQSLKLELP